MHMGNMSQEERQQEMGMEMGAEKFFSSKLL